MSIQFLGKVKYSPARDIYHILPDVIKSVAEHLIVGPQFPPLSAWLKAQGFDAEDLADGVHAYAQFMTIAKTESGVKRHEALQRSGWHDVPWQVQVALMHYVGAAMTGIFYEGAAMDGRSEKDQLATLRSLLDAGQDVLTYLSLPAWKRWLYRRRYQRRLSDFNG